MSSTQHSLPTALDPDHDLNPWKDPVHNTDPATINVFGHKDTVIPKEVLSEFDPLASPEEQAARDAWQTSEGHPPPPSSEESVDPTPPSTSVLPPSRSLSPFPIPSLASLAKTFSLPSLTRPRPPSMDAASPVHPPSNLSTVVTGQGAEEESEAQGSSNEPPPTSPPSEHEADTEIFDFQRFLDQMKSRSAEPVSKYLRS